MSNVQKPKLIVVLEPFAYSDTEEECFGKMEWVMVKLDIDWVNSALACEGRHGFIHEVHGPKPSSNKKEVCIHESVGSYTIKLQHRKS